MANSEKNPRWRPVTIRMFILKTKFVDMVKCYSNEDRHGYIGWPCVSHDLIYYAVIVQKYVIISIS